jgi:peptidoglycan hydrolase-like protein with peptidoglycan-binding domain
MSATISEAKGSAGADVTKWQELLSAAGFSVAISGVFDAATDAATKAWQKAKGLVADGIVGPASWGTMTGTVQGGNDPRAKEGRDAMLAAWPSILDEASQSKYPEVRALGAMGQPTLSELQIFGAMANLESGYGHSQYVNKKIPEGQPGHSSGVIWNWGAEQAGKPPCDPSKSFEASDSGAEGAYTMCYAKHATQAEGALAFLRQVTIRRPYSWAIAKTGDIDKYSIAMHSWTPPLEALGQGHAGKVPNHDPITDVPGYFEQPPMTAKGRAWGLEYRSADIAATLGEPLMAKRGGPVTSGGEGGGEGITADDVATGGLGVAIVSGVVGAALLAWRIIRGSWPWPF